MSPEKKIHVWFLGTSAFAVPSLEALAEDPAFSVDLVITQPDRPAGRKQELMAPSVKIATQKFSLPVAQPENINDDLQPTTYNLQPPHFLVVVSFGQILSEDILSLPTIAPVNVHASLLPRWRGASPIHHALLSGDAETGVTVQKMVRELDAGPILAQETIAIEPRETFTSLHEKLAPLGAKLLIPTLKHPLHPINQDPAQVTVCRTLKREDGSADPETMTAEEIDRRVRALNPWPGVTHGTLKILETALTPTKDSTPLLCANGSTLHLTTVQPAGGTPMSGAAWQRGQQ